MADPVVVQVVKEVMQTVLQKTVAAWVMQTVLQNRGRVGDADGRSQDRGDAI